MDNHIRWLTAVAAGLLLAASLLLPAATVNAANSTKVIHQASLKVNPLCMTVSRKHRKLHVVLRHGVKKVDYAFALLPLFGNGKVSDPSLGKHRADRRGFIAFNYPAPNHKKNVGQWQVTATRQISKRTFKLAAIAHFKVRWGRCHRKK